MVKTAKKTEKNICEFYLDIQRQHSEEFPNEKVAVILQVGDFYEFYGINTDTRKESILKEVCDVLSKRLDHAASGAFVAALPTCANFISFRACCIKCRSC